jgi:hypothetical protein
LSDKKIRPTPIFLSPVLIDIYTGIEKEVKCESATCSEESSRDREISHDDERPGRSKNSESKADCFLYVRCDRSHVHPDARKRLHAHSRQLAAGKTSITTDKPLPKVSKFLAPW